MTYAYVLTDATDNTLWGVLSSYELAVKAMLNRVRGGRFTFDCMDEDAVSWDYWWIDTETGEVVKYNIERVEMDASYLFVTD